MSHPHQTHIDSITKKVKTKGNKHGVPSEHYMGDLFSSLTHPSITRLFDLANKGDEAAIAEGRHRLALTHMIIGSLCEHFREMDPDTKDELVDRSIKASEYALTGKMPT